MNTKEHFVGQVTQKAVLKHRGAFVIVKEAGSDMWILPGGRLNFGESTDEGFLREIHEELGASARIERLLSVESVERPGKTSKLFVFYHAVIDDNDTIVPANEITDIAYISKKEEVSAYRMHDNQRMVLEKFLP